MPLSLMSLFNMALYRIGTSSFVTDPNAKDKVTLACNTNYETCRNSVLEGWDWKFASSRAQLAQSAAAPIFGWTYQYPLPADCLVVRDISPKSADYVVEGKNLLTNAGNPTGLTGVTVYIRYTARIEDPTVFTSLCAKAIAWRLAAEIAPALIHEKELQKKIMDEYLLIIQEAQSANQQYDKDHNEDPGWWMTNKYAYAGVGDSDSDSNQLLNNIDDWVLGGTSIVNP
jgi:hypothetical protein